MNSERGSMSAVVVCLTLSAIALAGLVFDGGNAVNTYSHMSDLAENAARVGAQNISGIRAGHPFIQKSDAISAMKAFIGNCGCDSQFDIEGQKLIVSLSTSVPVRVLGIIGITNKSIHVSRTVEVVDG